MGHFDGRSPWMDHEIQGLLKTALDPRDHIYGMLISPDGLVNTFPACFPHVVDCGFQGRDIFLTGQFTREIVGANRRKHSRISAL